MSEEYDSLAQALLGLKREMMLKNMRLLARFKALEASAAALVPEGEREAWYQRLDAESARILQVYLERFEDESPSFAAWLDDRGPDELRNL